ncbi:hypothetical protein B296_00058800 [Ensete ventricosum]|uniref:Uncharacterized protein n=1 Tax=Ensete ventricosum TaxID=4639 RepID=A0A426XKF5_ENSVE|nr:hypothetical protein B296_00058800 [Ensete ventricosum]
MIGVFSLSCLEGDMGLIGFTRAFLHNISCVSLLSRCADSSGHWTPDDDVDLLLNEPLRSWGWVSGPLDLTLEVPAASELFYLIAEVVAVFYVIVIVPMKLIVLRPVSSLYENLQREGPLTAPQYAGTHLGWAVRGVGDLEKTEEEESEALEALEVGLAPGVGPTVEGSVRQAKE